MKLYTYDSFIKEGLAKKSSSMTLKIGNSKFIPSLWKKEDYYFDTNSCNFDPDGLDMKWPMCIFFRSSSINSVYSFIGYAKKINKFVIV